ncbi:PFU-domain-containing protein [Rhizopus microsporus var. microsporus]|uniref:PFU-domain-containing protein n=2 Tax=Rhizopus microsporus TaxID=58291 RepID=A0A2G4T252_RHIZD|nr:PFU-domain-containing protein [Rhizopus microsporus ATCC 52813]ORE05478.1 PFU-domain-containing protein [Rhizopus microsporus var. microsporus]PHZ15092.1 PFU-domain-containing protein [Rhizopus microsporus ATCC 52813]
MSAQPYRLASVLAGHDQDIKAIAAATDDLIISAARDKTVRSWSRIAPNGFSLHNIYLGHDHFVNSLAIIKPNEAFPEGLIVSSGSDKFINVYQPNQPAEPLYTLIGHTENVTTLKATPSGYIVSGSWDKKVIVWKGFQKAYSLEGHEAAVWAVLPLNDDTILTASADKTIRLWKNGKLAHTYQGHTDAVRGLALVTNDTFVSCSNDATLRVWKLDGTCLQVLYGHTSFVYSVDVLGSGEFISSGEDRTVRVWKDGECVQTIQQPCISVWSVAGLPNGDIVVGGSDAVVRIFTRDEKRMAPAEALKEFDELLANQAIPSNQIGDVNKNDLPGPEALTKPGTKEGQVIMVNVGANVEAHQWSSQTQSWQKIGEVVGGVGSGSNKQLYEGKEYDYVFDIDIGAGPGGNLKLPYNVTQNAYDAAEKFLIKHDLPQSFREEIATFIIKNTGSVNLGSGEYQDPFTGANRYTPVPNYQTTNTSGAFVDPFTGQGSYRPTQPTVPTSSSANYNDPFTGKNSYQTSSTAGKVLPIKNYLTLKQANLDAVRNKIYTFSAELAPVHLYDEQLQDLEAIICYIKDPTGKASVVSLAVIVKMCTMWPEDKRFPALDLLRLLALYYPEELNSMVQDIVTFIKVAGGLSPTSAGNETNAMLAFRALANLFNTEYGRQIMWEKRTLIAEIMQVDITGRFKSKAARLAQSTLAVK